MNDDIRIDAGLRELSVERSVSARRKVGIKIGQRRRIRRWYDVRTLHRLTIGKHTRVAALLHSCLDQVEPT